VCSVIGVQAPHQLNLCSGLNPGWVVEIQTLVVGGTRPFVPGWRGGIGSRQENSPNRRGEDGDLHPIRPASTMWSRIQVLEIEDRAGWLKGQCRGPISARPGEGVSGVCAAHSRAIIQHQKKARRQGPRGTTRFLPQSAKQQL